MKMFINKFLNKNLQTSKFFHKFSNNKNFSTTHSKNELYIWVSNAAPGMRMDDYKNKYSLRNFPKRLDFFNDKNPQYIYMGPRHSGCVTQNGELYTFGSGNWGVLGHGNEDSVKIESPKLVEYFSKNKIKIQKVCMGDFHTLALDDNGNVYSWGYGGKKGFMNLLFTGNINK
jgi:hypothetical protein